MPIIRPKAEVGQIWFYKVQPSMQYLISRIEPFKAYHYMYSYESLFDHLDENGCVTTALIEKGWHWNWSPDAVCLIHAMGRKDCPCE